MTPVLVVSGPGGSPAVGAWDVLGLSAGRGDPVLLLGCRELHAAVTWAEGFARGDTAVRYALILVRAGGVE